tara:strand:- start:888 stop:1169 length:282 start_codon:yes stop_codon:yes gene_type:complete
MEYDNTNRGVLFVNDRKTTDKQPTHKGSIYVGTVKMGLSAWEKTSNTGKKFLSLSVSEWTDSVRGEEQPASVARVAMPQTAAFVDDEMDNIPF